MQYTGDPRSPSGLMPQAIRDSAMTYVGTNSPLSMVNAALARERAPRGGAFRQYWGTSAPQSGTLAGDNDSTLYHATLLPASPQSPANWSPNKGDSALTYHERQQNINQLLWNKRHSDQAYRPLGDSTPQYSATPQQQADALKNVNYTATVTSGDTRIVDKNQGALDIVAAAVSAAEASRAATEARMLGVQRFWMLAAAGMAAYCLLKR